MADQLGLDLDDAPKAPRAGVLRSAHLRNQPVPIEEALALEKRAAAQEASILGYFAAFAGTAAPGGTAGRFTPSEVHAVFPAWPITSVRRALTNLTRRGLLVHYPAHRRRGPMGASESTWGLA